MENQMVQTKEALPVDLSTDILNNSFDAIVYYIPKKDEYGKVTDFIFTYINDSAFKLLKGRREDYINKTFNELFPYGLVNGMFEDFKKTYKTGQECEKTYYYEQGDYRGWYRNSIIKYGHGIVVFFRDVTDRELLQIELGQRNQELELAVNEKEILLHEINHRVKNNLQIIVSLINLQAGLTETQEVKDILSGTVSRIKSLAMLHGHLGYNNMAGSIEVDSYIENVIRSLQSSYKERMAAINYSGCGIIMDGKIVSYLGLIINELISNCLKYGKDDGKVIELNFKKEGSEFELIVRDNGGGYPAGSLPEKSKGLGLQLVNAFVMQLGGKVEFYNDNGAVTRVIFREGH